jgi:hypothetical protein
MQGGKVARRVKCHGGGVVIADDGDKLDIILGPNYLPRELESIPFSLPMAVKNFLPFLKLRISHCWVPKIQHN